MMDDRPSQRQIFMELAKQFARRSTCQRASVGTVIASEDFRKVLAIGHNGNASGLPNQCDRAEPGNCGCLHAEENACIHCDCPRDTPKIVFTTVMPCVMCAKRLINLGGVKEIYYVEPYRSINAAVILSEVGISLSQLMPPEHVKETRYDFPTLNCDCYGGCWGDHSVSWYILEFPDHLRVVTHQFCNEEVKDGDFVLAAGELRLAKYSDFKKFEKLLSRYD